MLDRAKLFVGRVPRFVTVGERDPQPQVRATLHGFGPPLDVTRAHVIASLRPLALTVMLPPLAAAEATTRRTARLVFSPWNRPGETLGYVDLRLDRVIDAGGTAFHVLQVERHRNACMAPWVTAAYALAHAWTERKHRPSYYMERRERWAFEVLYICPRPVVLVSVANDGQSNMFPMDLIGPASEHFLLALRSSSPSIPLLKGSGRVTIADVALPDAALATGLGDRHKKAHIDWDNLPFPIDRSPAHGLRVPRRALRVRDLEIRDAREVGSHTLFVTDVLHEERRSDGPQMFTICGPYYRWLRLAGISPETGDVRG